MAEQSSPLWKQVFDAVDQRLSPTINDLAKSEDAVNLAALGQRSRRGVERQLEHASRRVLHVLNLPAGSDINRLLAHIARLEREVRDLRNQLADRENAEFLASLAERHEVAELASAPVKRTTAKKTAAKRPTTKRTK